MYLSGSDIEFLCMTDQTIQTHKMRISFQSYAHLLTGFVLVHTKSDSFQMLPDSNIHNFF